MIQCEATLAGGLFFKKWLLTEKILLKRRI